MLVVNEPLLLGAIEAGATKFLCAVNEHGGTILTETRIATHARWRMPAEQLPADHPAWDIEADYITAPTAGASAGLTGALALADRTATRQWPMHWGMAEPSNTNKETAYA